MWTWGSTLRTARCRWTWLSGNPYSWWGCRPGRWFLFFQLQVSSPPPPPLSFNAVNWFSFFALVNMDSTGLYRDNSISLEHFLNHHYKECVLWLAALLWISGKFLAHTVVRSRKVILGCSVGCLRPGLFVHGGEGGFTHRFGWPVDWFVQLHCCSESSCWLYNFPTFTCVQSNKRPAKIYTTQCGWNLGSSAMLSSYIYVLHFQALWSSDSENYINSSSQKETLRESERERERERERRLRSCFSLYIYNFVPKCVHTLQLKIKHC